MVTHFNIYFLIMCNNIESFSYVYLYLSISRHTILTFPKIIGLLSCNNRWIFSVTMVPNFHPTINLYERIDMDIKDLTFSYDISCIMSGARLFYVRRALFSVRWPLIFIAINWKYSSLRNLSHPYKCLVLFINHVKKLFLKIFIMLLIS